MGAKVLDELLERFERQRPVSSAFPDGRDERVIAAETGHDRMSARRRRSVVEQASKDQARARTVQ
jgi:hypothetical protein